MIDATSDKKSKLIASTKASKQKFDINNIKSFLEKNITEDIIRTFLIKEILEKILVQNINNRIVLDIYLNSTVILYLKNTIYKSFSTIILYLQF